MSFYSKLREKLRNKLPERLLDQLPRSYQILGKILVIRLKPGLLTHRKAIGKAVLDILPYIHTVILEKEIKGVKRKPRIEIIAGCRKSTETLYKEHGYQFLLDVSKIMWSKGNKEERQRYVKLAKPNETVVDMFAGIGYWSMFLAKRVRKVYSIDINKDAVEYLRRNVWLNRVEDRVEILEGDCRKFSGYLEGVADRVIMGHLFETEKFLPYALKIAKKGAVIHLHRIVKEGEKMRFKGVKVLGVRRVKSYAPRVWHVVYDLKKQ